MTTAAERLLTLAGRSGSAGELLSAFAGAGPAGTRLASWSGIGTAAAWGHLMAERPRAGGGAWGGRWVRLRMRRKDEDLTWLMMPI